MVEVLEGTEVYPRTGGGNAGYTVRQVAKQGLSPHGRGKLLNRAGRLDLLRSIPARAGETPRRSSLGGVRGVYPRTGGGNETGWRKTGMAKGLSPHGRGKP